MLSNSENKIINILKNIPIFKGLDDQELKKIIPILEQITYAPDTHIIKNGTTGTSMHIVKDGTVSISRMEENKDRILLGTLSSGSYFGELALIDNLPRSADVISNEKTEIFRLNKNDFDKLLSENIHIENTFYKNCLKETISGFRNISSNLSFSQHILKEKSAILEEIDKDLSLAKKIQDYFISTEYLDNEQIFSKGIRHSYIYKPCLVIGGDFINIVKINDDLVGMIIADFEGHGINAALATGVLKSALSIILPDLGDKPVKLMDFLNQHFWEVIYQLYATCYYALINTKEQKITLAKAGHHHPLFWKKRINDFVSIDCAGRALGIISEAKFEQAEFDIEDGDKILFFTDGIIEQINENNEMYSQNRLMMVFKKLIQNDEKKILNRLFQDLTEFANGVNLEDDITLLLLEV